MQKKPLVSIICICYNHQEYVIETLESVINQTYENIEIIIVDDCSNDDSVKQIESWLQKYPNIIFIKNKKNIGNTKTFNLAFEFSKGDYIIDLATDDVLLPCTVEYQIDCFQNSHYKNLGIVYGNLEQIDSNNNHIGYFFKVDKNLKRIHPQPTGDIYKSILSIKNNVCSVSSMVKRDVYLKLGCYDSTLYYEDLDFWIRASRTYEFDYIDKILVKKRVLAGSLSAIRWKRFNVKTRKFNDSTFKILQKATRLNKSKDEDQAILNFINHEIGVSIKTIDINLLIKYILLYLKLKIKILF